MDLQSAALSFANGFAATRSLTYPFEVIRHEDLIAMRDSPHRTKRGRAQEVIGVQLAADEAIRQIKSYRPQGRWFYCAIQSPEADLAAHRDEVKRHGMRLMHHEPFFVFSRPQFTPLTIEREIVRVQDVELASEVNDLCRSRQILAEHLLEDSPIRLYAALQNDQVVGYVRSVDAGDNSTWVSNLAVLPHARRQGFGHALMARLLNDDFERGVAHVVLLASSDGTPLYESMSFSRIGTLQMFQPVAKIWAQFLSETT